MTETVSIRTRSDVANVVPRVLGFVPTDSLVILATGGAPTARVDLVDSAALAEGLAPALPHWQASPVVLVVYGTPADLGRIHADLGEILPGVTPVDLFAVTDAHTVDLDGTREAIDYAPTGTSLDAVPVGFDRDSVATEQAASVTDADTAVTLAVEAYLAGNGALAWIFHDRALDLGSTVVRLAVLAVHLTKAIAPNASVFALLANLEGES